MSKLEKSKKIIHISLMCLVVMIFATIFAITLPKKFSLGDNAFWILLTFLLNLSAFVTALVFNLKKYPYSFSSIMWIFNIFFFFLAPVLQYLNNKWPWGIVLDSKSIIAGNLLIFLFSGIYELTYYLTLKRQKENEKQNKKMEDKDEREIKYRSLLTTTLFTLVFVGIILINSNPSDVLSKYTMGNAFSFIKEGFLVTLVLNFARYYVTFVFLFNVIFVMKNKKINLSMVISTVSMITVCFPFSLTRFVLATVYLGVYLVATKRSEFSNKIFVYLFVLAVIIAFPLFGGLSYGFNGIAGFVDNVLGVIKEFNKQYLTANYDAYANFVETIEYCSENDVTFGRQLLGCFLFFVPRKFWPNKPIGSGAFLAESTGKSFTNIAMPFVGEGYINFGFVGVLVFAVLLGWFSSKMDYSYWKKDKFHVNNIYPYLLVFSFFMMRGDLMTSFTHVTAMVVTYFVIVIIMKIVDKIKFTKKLKKEDKVNEHI